jgi:hypothetical protein
MTIEVIYRFFAEHSLLLALVMVVAPWLPWLICFLIPGYREDPVTLSLNLWLATIAMLLWVGYIAFATNQGGWARVVREANLLLLLVPPYYLFSSLWLTKQRIPLNLVPAFKTLQGVMMMGGAFLVLSWILARIRIVLFSFLPFSWFLGFLAALVLVGYLGYKQIIDD